ncbi:MAG: hypothetical protein D6772_10310 [Bacteroidetes bacterium]|nr:MAG: hypothetical protein D6772_10310 [Bacteroidota bacterium]
MTKAKIGLLILGWYMPMIVNAQALERFQPKGAGAGEHLRTYASVLDLCAHPRGVYACTEREGCFLLPTHQDDVAIPVVSPRSRRDRFGPILQLAQVPHVVINGYQVQSLVQPEQGRRPLLPSQVVEHINVVAYEVLPDGRLAIASARDGVFLFTADAEGSYRGIPQRISTVNRHLPSNKVNCLYQDRDGILWIGTEGGLAAFWQDSVYNLAQAPPLPTKLSMWQRLLGRHTKANPIYRGPVSAITQWGGSLLFTSHDALYKITRKLEPLTQVHRYANPPEYGFSTPVHDLQVSWGGKVWIATNHLIRYDIANESWRILSTSGERHSEAIPVNCLLEDKLRAYIWVGTAGRGLQRLPLQDGLNN